MKTLTRTIAAQMAPAVLVLASLVAPAAQLQTPPVHFWPTALFGVAASIVFSLFSGSLGLFLPGVFQTFYLARLQADLPQVIFVSGVFGVLSYAAGLTYYFQKLLSRSMLVATSLLAVLCFFELSAPVPAKASQPTLQTLLPVGCVLVLLSFALVSNSTHSKNMAISAGLGLAFCLSAVAQLPAAAGGLFSGFAFDVAPLLGGQHEFAGFSNKAIIRGCFLGLVGLLESSVSGIVISRNSGTNQLPKLHFQLAVLNLVGGLFGLRPLAVPILASQFAPVHSDWRHPAFLFLLAKLVCVAGCIFHSATPGLMWPVAAMFVSLHFLIVLRAGFHATLKISQGSSAGLAGLLMFIAVFALTRHILLAFATSFLLDLTWLLLRTPGLSTSRKHKQFGGFEDARFDFTDAVVYKPEGGLHFLFLDWHRRRIMELSQHHVVVDLRSVESTPDADYLEGYREFAEAMEQETEKTVEVFGLEKLRTATQPRAQGKTKAI